MSDTFQIEFQIYEHFKDCSWDDIDQHDFGRWLQQHDAEIAKATEERIIKLLEADCKDGIGDNLQGCFHEVAIELIKGEQK